MKSMMKYIKLNIRTIILTLAVILLVALFANHYSAAGSYIESFSTNDADFCTNVREPMVMSNNRPFSAPDGSKSEAPTIDFSNYDTYNNKIFNSNVFFVINFSGKDDNGKDLPPTDKNGKEFVTYLYYTSFSGTKGKTGNKSIYYFGPKDEFKSKPLEENTTYKISVTPNKKDSFKITKVDDKIAKKVKDCISKTINK